MITKLKLWTVGPDWVHNYSSVLYLKKKNQKCDKANLETISVIQVKDVGHEPHVSCLLFCDQFNCFCFV